jgi:homoserine kinase
MLFDSSSSVCVEVPASSANLGPGFDCLGLALGLWNRLELRLAARDELELSGEGESQLKGQTTSLAHRAARIVWEELELETTGFAISMHSAVPLARGLGSSSAAIVGGLFAANEWARGHRGAALSSARLLDLATRIEGHPDNVAPALLGGFTVCAMREDGRVFAVSPRVPVAPRFVVWIPEVELSTEKARAALPSVYSRADCMFNLSRSALLVAALTTGDFEALGESLRDRVHQDFRAPLVPGWNELNEAARELGALGTTLSGAGPTILFWLAPSHDGATFVSSIEGAARAHGLAGRALELAAAGAARIVEGR